MNFEIVFLMDISDFKRGESVIPFVFDEHGAFFLDRDNTRQMITWDLLNVAFSLFSHRDDQTLKMAVRLTQCVYCGSTMFSIYPEKSISVLYECYRCHNFTAPSFTIN